MANRKDNYYFIEKIVSDLQFIMIHTENLTEEEFYQNEILLDSVMFRMIQVSGNIRKISDEFKDKHPEISWISIVGLRNRIVHEYGKIDLRIIYETIKKDIPELVKYMKEL